MLSPKNQAVDTWTLLQVSQPFDAPLSLYFIAKIAMSNKIVVQFQSNSLTGNLPDI
jgi:hypothetical protein